MACHPFNLKVESSICSHIFLQNVHSFIVQFTILHSRLRILQVCINVPVAIVYICKPKMVEMVGSSILNRCFFARTRSEM